MGEEVFVEGVALVRDAVAVEGERGLDGVDLVVLLRMKIVRNKY